MSHHLNEIIICPNCGSKAAGNYCAQCGQENYLHQETTWAHFMHFFGHYFHYDSKFWKTLKVLWLQPGALTLAYWKKQRMRYISPMSLYLFISAAYFLIAFSLPHHEEHPGSVHPTVVGASPGPMHQIRNHHIVRYFKQKANKIAAEKHVQARTYITDKVWHSAPKLMFLMIPILAWLLKVRFNSRGDLHFVDHTIFSFHIHCFWFSIRLLSFIEITSAITLIMDIFFCTIFSLYMSLAIKKAYSVHTVNALFTFAGIALLYIFALAVATATVLTLYLMIV
jgi:hypothetical protein